VPSPELDQFLQSLEINAVVPLTLAVFAAALLGFALKWIENRLSRMMRARRLRHRNSLNR